jgi:catechol 2,3-dioxygenase-like lactoylglutathione lyase family enzyme
MRSLLLLLAAAVCSAAELPDMYRRVDRLLWVVDDIPRAIAGWRALGIAPGAAPIREDKQLGIRYASARFGDANAWFVQPATAAGPFADFHKRRGAGVMAVLHRPASREAMQAEVARLRDLGVGVLHQGRLDSAEYVLFDTEREGKYALGLVLDDVAPQTEPSRKISQYAFVARDLEAVSRYWTKLGFPPMSFTHPPLWDLRYHDQPGQFDALLGWQRHGAVVYEWIQPLKGPTVYNDQLDAHGEGLHHIAFNVPDLDAASAEWTRKGYPFVQGGAWGERDKPGYGRFAYQNTQTLGGTDVELLWNYGR